MTMKMIVRGSGIAVTLLAVALSGCAGAGKATKAEPVAAPAAGTLSGKVVETMDAGGYTYINLEKDGKKSWVAVPSAKVTVGQELSVLPGAEMTAFASKSLNRTFDKIIFSGGLANAAPAAPTVDVDPKESATPILAGKVVETMDAANYTYIYIEKDGKRSWAAVPATNVKVGDEIELLPGTAMGKFTSKLLNKTFNSIYFTGGIKNGVEKAAAKEGHPKGNGDGGQLPAGHPKLDGNAAKASAPAAQAPAGHAGHAAADAKPADKAAAPAAAKSSLSGKVVETMNAGGYSYICLEKEGQKIWVAVPAMQVNVGEQMTMIPGVTMTNFVSKSLNRTFDKIIFTDGPQK